jgi:hypothetical protein
VLRIDAQCQLGEPPYQYAEFLACAPPNYERQFGVSYAIIRESNMVGSKMRDELAEHFIAELERAFQAVGATDYEAGLGVTIRFLEVIFETAEQVNTREKAREVLKKMPEPSESELPFYLAGLGFLPQLVTMGVQFVGNEMKSDFPEKRGPKGKLTAHEQRQACEYIGKLLAQGMSLKISQERAAAKFHVSKRKIERVWQGRKNLSAIESQIEFNQVASWAKQLLQSNNSEDVDSQQR